MFIKTAVYFIGLCIVLSGCLDSRSQALLDAYDKIMPNMSPAPPPSLLPWMKYLRVDIDGLEAYMALGTVDKTPQGKVQIWFDSERNIIRLLNGRVVGSTIKDGINWLSVSFHGLPQWSDIKGQQVFDRSRDVSPGYRYGIKENIQIRPIAPPEDTNLQGFPAASLQWFEEKVLNDDEMPPSLYGVLVTNEQQQVIYSEQCLSEEYCLSMQTWPPPVLKLNDG